MEVLGDIQNKEGPWGERGVQKKMECSAETNRTSTHKSVRYITGVALESKLRQHLQARRSKPGQVGYGDGCQRESEECGCCGGSNLAKALWRTGLCEIG